MRSRHPEFRSAESSVAMTREIWVTQKGKDIRSVYGKVRAKCILEDRGDRLVLAAIMPGWTEGSPEKSQRKVYGSTDNAVPIVNEYSVCHRNCPSARHIRSRG